MGSLTQYAQKKVLDHLLKGASYSPPAHVYLGLSTANPTDDGTGWASPTYTGYARKELDFGAAAARVITQNATVTFDPCTVGSSVVTHWGIWDQLAAGGNLLAYGTLSAPKTIVVGNTPSVASPDITVTFSAGGVFTAMADTILNWLFAAGSLSQPTHVKVALSTTIPTDGGPNITEPGGGVNYAQVTQDSWNGTTLATPGVATNNGVITFGAPSGDWGTIVYAVVYLDTDPFAYLDVTDQDVNIGDTVEFADTALHISLG